MIHFFTPFRSAFLLYVLVMIVVTCFILYTIPARNRIGVDLRSFYTSGVMVHSGVKDKLYDFPTQMYWQKKLFHNISMLTPAPFLYPPFVAALFSVLVWMSYQQLYVSFAFLNMMMILGTIYLLLKNLYPNEGVGKYTYLLVITLFYFPIIFIICVGQLSFFTTGYFILLWFSLKREKFFLAGIFMGCLLFKPYMLILPILIFFWKSQWMILIGFILMGSLLSVISLYIVGLDGIIRYIHLLFLAPSAGEQLSQFPQREPTLRGILQLAVHSDSLFSIILPFVVGVFLFLILLFYVWKATQNTRKGIFDIQYAVLLTAILFTSIHTNYYDLVLLIFPFLTLLKYIHNRLVFYIVGMIGDSILFCFYPQPAFLAPFVVLLLLGLCLVYKMDRNREGRSYV